MRDSHVKALRWRVGCIAFVALSWSSGRAVGSGPQSTVPLTVLRCGHLLSTATGELLGESSVIVDGKRIREVRAGHGSVPGAQVIDLKSATCLPGLIDLHTHLTDEWSQTTQNDQFRLNPVDYAIRGTVNARRTLNAGFTTVRNLGDVDNESIALRNAINVGLIAGPRIFTAGKPIGSTGGHADPTDGYSARLAGDPTARDGVINSQEDAWKAVRQHYKEGVDVIKVMASGGVLEEGRSADNAQLTIEEIMAIVSAAHDYGFTVAAHAHGKEAIRRAVLGGVDSIEHGTFMDDEDLHLMKEHGTWFVPTLSAGDYAVTKARTPGFFPPTIAAKALAVGTRNQGVLAKAYKVGVNIAFGTDAGVYPHGQNAHEFELMVKNAGLPPLFAIQAATLHAARFLRMEKEIGQVEAGFDADVIAVNGNPIDDISLMRHVAFVMKDGVAYKTAD